ncbi:hypothetical protein HRS9122_08506 [Pyrenophora teres f. teres]|nr:hypothetical protein HRS9122_08506 [Pyrenophora teres f. teres]
MAVPYQCLVARRSGDSGDWTLFGASGSKIFVQSSNGVTSTWPAQDVQTEGQQDDEDGERPGKRIKLDQPKEHKANFSNLIISNDGQYLVGITGEDKCVRVFQIDTQNSLQQLSERCMSRRPSSIILTSDDTTILCADKFGDVYALPLLPLPEDEKAEQPEAPAAETEQKDWLPSATTLTVHSGRNRKTLEEQLKQKAKGLAKSKEPMRFKHQLLLGHVSMLTDVVYAKVNGRSYIITADRDEHIRISRGLPQAHIIEGFCFGHETFISKLCLTPSGLLVSGGGDDYLYVWDWQNCALKEKIAIRDSAFAAIQTQGLVAPGTDHASYKVAISGLWTLPTNENNADEILAACEGVPALFHFKMGDAHAKHIPLNGNALDVAMIQTSISPMCLIISIDNIHKAGSTTEVRNDKVPRLQYFSRQADGEWIEDAHMATALSGFAHGREADSNGLDAGESAVRSMLYNVENLRKRPGADD